MLRAIAFVLVISVSSLAGAAAAEPYVLDVILPITGSGAFAGAAEQQTIQLYERLANKTGGIHGRPVHFEIHDDQSNPVVAVQIVNELLPKKPVVIFGPSVAATCSAVSPLLAGGVGPVEYCFSPVAVPPRGGYVFAVLQSVQASESNQVARVRSMGYRRLALLSATDASGQQDSKIVQDQLRLPENASLALVEAQQFSPTDLSIAAQVAKIKAAQPDIIVVFAIGPAFLMTMRELSGAGLDVPVITNPFNADGDLLRRNQAILPKTLVVGGLPYQAKNPPRALRDAAAEYLTAFRGAGLKPTSVVQSYAWDPVKITVAALRALPPGATPAQLHDYIENLHDFAGLFGVYDFRSHDQHGLEGNDEPLVRWDGVRGDWIYFGN